MAITRDSDRKESAEILRVLAISSSEQSKTTSPGDSLYKYSNNPHTRHMLDVTPLRGTVPLGLPANQRQMVMESGGDGTSLVDNHSIRTGRIMPVGCSYSVERPHFVTPAADRGSGEVDEEHQLRSPKHLALASTDGGRIVAGLESTIEESTIQPFSTDLHTSASNRISSGDQITSFPVNHPPPPPKFFASSSAIESSTDNPSTLPEPQKGSKGPPVGRRRPKRPTASQVEAAKEALTVSSSGNATASLPGSTDLINEMQKSVDGAAGISSSTTEIASGDQSARQRTSSGEDKNVGGPSSGGHEARAMSSDAEQVVSIGMKSRPIVPRTSTTTEKAPVNVHASKTITEAENHVDEFTPGRPSTNKRVGHRLDEPGKNKKKKGKGRPDDADEVNSVKQKVAPPREKRSIIADTDEDDFIPQEAAPPKGKRPVIADKDELVEVVTSINKKRRAPRLDEEDEWCASDDDRPKPKRKPNKAKDAKSSTVTKKSRGKKALPELQPTSDDCSPEPLLASRAESDSSGMQPQPVVVQHSVNEREADAPVDRSTTSQEQRDEQDAVSIVVAPKVSEHVEANAVPQEALPSHITPRRPLTSKKRKLKNKSDVAPVTNNENTPVLDQLPSAPRRLPSSSPQRAPTSIPLQGVLINVPSQPTTPLIISNAKDKPLPITTTKTISKQKQKTNRNVVEVETPTSKKFGLASVLAKMGHGRTGRIGLKREKCRLHMTINPSPRIVKRIVDLKSKNKKRRDEYDWGEDDENSKGKKESEDDEDDEEEVQGNNHSSAVNGQDDLGGVEEVEDLGA